MRSREFVTTLAILAITAILAFGGLLFWHYRTQEMRSFFPVGVQPSFPPGLLHATSVNNKSESSEPPPSIASSGRKTLNNELGEIDLVVGSNATFLIEDPYGRRTGKDPATGQVLQEIPNSAYFEDRISNVITGKASTKISHQIQLSQPLEGIYGLTVIGLQPGPFEVIVRVFSEDGSAQPELLEDGTTVPGLQTKYQLDVAAPGSTTTISNLPR
jgi:hypothetical protein